MKPHRVRQICRSRNPFTPSIALWQHFVLPWHALRQQRPIMYVATEAAPGSLPSTETQLSPPAPMPADAPKDQIEYEPNREPVIRRVADTRAQIYDLRRNTGKATGKSERKIEHLMQKTMSAFDESEDYEGVVVEAITTARAVDEKLLPWVIQNKAGERGTAEDRLALEIAKFHDYARPSRTEALGRRNIIEQVRNHVREALPSHILEVFGSERTGIALATSDIDLRLMRHEDLVDGRGKMPPDGEERRLLLKDLQTLHRKKFYGNRAYLMPVMRHARYPLISLQDRASGIDVQIVLSNDTSLSRELMQQYMQEFPFLRQLYSVVKTIFDARGLSDVFRGGFGSYTIFMMVVASLKHKPHKRNDAMGALLNFLRFWGHFDTTKQGVSIEPPILFDKSEVLVMTDTAKQHILSGKHKPLPPYMMCLRDPADETNDLGRRAIAIKHVQTTFRHLDKKLTKDLTANTRHSFLKLFVGDIFTLNKARRQKLDAEGRKVLKTMQTSIAHKAQAIIEEEHAATQKARATDQKAVELNPRKPDESLHDDMGETVTSILEMPSVEELGKDGLDVELKRFRERHARLGGQCVSGN
ncbi:hypothetical protein K458DRAFT_332404 [Lentithecium fluviatile CBS 122367]|uniref:polynucleotide adenylyltransferase n=1 Tax=Lentithecium fluviatile CBS 122367 TaxID=1168545 RepID=A0A6G1JBL6_9PLEO|nr:hypothetical protein K458DRAFT_332404 [Lentithecium fluviatile CBS 122367]